jgi:hypothetical protein
MEFFRAAPYDRAAVVLTGVGLLALGGVGLLVAFLPVPVLELRLGIPSAAFLILLLTYSFSPQGFSVGPEGVRLHEAGNSVLLPLASLRRARRAEPRELCGLRTFGSGGLFGFFGWFWSRQFGHYRAFVTNRHRLVLIEADRVYLLSPDRPEEFLRRLADWRPDLAADAATTFRG